MILSSFENWLTRLVKKNILHFGLLPEFKKDYIYGSILAQKIGLSVYVKGV